MMNATYEMLDAFEVWIDGLDEFAARCQDAVENSVQQGIMDAVMSKLAAARAAMAAARTALDQNDVAGANAKMNEALDRMAEAAALLKTLFS